jgi:hypothetical protein
MINKINVFLVCLKILVLSTYNAHLISPIRKCYVVG